MYACISTTKFHFETRKHPKRPILITREEKDYTAKFHFKTRKHLKRPILITREGEGVVREELGRGCCPLVMLGFRNVKYIISFIIVFYGQQDIF